MSWSADRIAQLMEDPEVPRSVADPLRSHCETVTRRGSAKADFPGPVERSFSRGVAGGLTPMVLHGRIPDFDRWLAKRAPSSTSAVLVTCHPVHAASRTARLARCRLLRVGRLAEVSAIPVARQLHRIELQTGERDVNVIGVTQAIVDRIGARRGSVVPNGIAAGDYERLGPLPSWFAELSGPIALYAGSLEERVDVAAVEQCARDLPDWTVVLVGHLATPRHFSRLAARPNVVVRGREPRSAALAMMSASDVCLIPHRRTPMSVAMSPLKLYEYLGAGTPVVATDLPPMRGVSDRCLLVPPGGRFAPAITAASLPAQHHEQRRRFLDR